MNTFHVTYIGRNSKFKNFAQIIEATSKRNAVEKAYAAHLSDSYFPQDDGSIKDADGHIVADATDETIDYDGGYFEADEIKQAPIYDVVFSDGQNDNNKGWALPYQLCLNYIQQYNGTKESYFADYKNGTVSIYNTLTQQNEYTETVK